VVQDMSKAGRQILAHQIEVALTAVRYNIDKTISRCNGLADFPAEIEAQPEAMYPSVEMMKAATAVRALVDRQMWGIDTIYAQLCARYPAPDTRTAQIKS